MLWRDLRAATKTEMAAWRQVMKQSDRAKRSERAVALMVERIKSTTSYAQMGARAGITAERARSLVARGVRKVAYGNAECNLSKDDLKTARLRNRLPNYNTTRTSSGSVAISIRRRRPPKLGAITGCRRSEATSHAARRSSRSRAGAEPAYAKRLRPISHLSPGHHHRF